MNEEEKKGRRERREKGEERERDREADSSPNRFRALIKLDCRTLG